MDFDQYLSESGLSQEPMSVRLKMQKAFDAGRAAPTAPVSRAVSVDTISSLILDAMVDFHECHGIPGDADHVAMLEQMARHAAISMTDMLSAATTPVSDSVLLAAFNSADSVIDGLYEVLRVAQSATLTNEGGGDFESFAGRQGMPLTRTSCASFGATRNGVPLATYYEDFTEGAWRAWANKPVASVAHDEGGKGEGMAWADAERIADLPAVHEALQGLSEDAPGASACKSCGGNNADVPCAYPEGGQPHCLKGASAQAEPVAWAPLTDEDRQAAFESLPDMLEGFMKKWGWLHFAKEIENRCREKNAAPPPSAAPVAQGLTEEAAIRAALRIMANLDDRSGVLDGVSDEVRQEIVDEIAVIILAQAAPSTSAQLTVPEGLIERLKGHSEDKRNTAFARSSMREAIEYLAAPAPGTSPAKENNNG